MGTWIGLIGLEGEIDVCVEGDSPIRVSQRTHDSATRAWKDAEIRDALEDQFSGRFSLGEWEATNKGDPNDPRGPEAVATVTRMGAAGG